MKGKNLAIKGHPTRGKEIIEILEMLGGNNKFFLDGTKELFYYYIGLDNNIYTGDDLTNIIIFSLEEFLEKYPFKVEDRVQHKSSISCGTIYTIEKMLWENNQIKYMIHNPCTVTAEDLQPFKEEIKAEDRLETYADPAIDNDSKTDIIINGEKLIAPRGYTVKNATTNGNSLIVEYIKNKQYPKTYAEYSQIINKVAKTTNELNIAYKPDLIYDFQKLLICRDAYWKIAGKEMGLSKPWEIPTNELVYYIYYDFKNNMISKLSGILYQNDILVFPTKEMRDAFFENFKDLIQGCEEFL